MENSHREEVPLDKKLHTGDYTSEIYDAACSHEYRWFLMLAPGIKFSLGTRGQSGTTCSRSIPALIFSLLYHASKYLKHVGPHVFFRNRGISVLIVGRVRIDLSRIVQVAVVRKDSSFSKEPDVRRAQTLLVGVVQLPLVLQAVLLPFYSGTIVAVVVGNKQRVVSSVNN